MKEIIIEAQRLGLKTYAVDKYENAPAMQVSHHSFVINMQNHKQLTSLINAIKHIRIPFRCPSGAISK